METKEVTKVISRDQKFMDLWSGTGFDPTKKMDCALEAGFKPSGARMQPGRIIDRLAQNKKMQKALKKKGVTIDKLASKVAELMECNHPLAREKDRPDTMTQLRATELGIRLQDAMPPARLDIESNERKEIIISAEVVERMEQYESREKKLKDSGQIIDVIPEHDGQS
jgi:hypothetical protein